MDNLLKEEWISFMNNHHSIGKPMMKCPICNEILTVVSYGSNTHAIPSVHSNSIEMRNAIECHQCNVEWTKKELFLMAQIKSIEERVIYIDGRVGGLY